MRNSLSFGRGLRGAWLSGLVAVGLAGSAEAGPACADLRLVLAIDASGSIDTGEYVLQLQGYARALADPRIAGAIRAAGVVEIGAIIWGDDRDAVLSYPPRRADPAGSLAGLIRDLAHAPRRTGGTTGLGRAVAEAAALLQQGGCAERMVIKSLATGARAPIRATGRGCHWPGPGRRPRRRGSRSTRWVS